MRTLAIRHVAFEDLGLIAGVLAERGHTIDYLDAGLDPIEQSSVLDADLVVALGGPIGVYDTPVYPFLHDEKAALAARLRAGRPTLGVCLGAQLMADALGAPVEPTGRTEIGYGALTLTADGRDSVLAPLDGIPVLHWHGDQFGIPDRARRLAQTPGFPNQAFAYGATALGLQFHLEADHTRIERWLIGHAHELAATGHDPRQIRADAAVAGPRLAGAARAVVHDWLDQL